MAGLFNDDEESIAATSEAPSIKPAVYGSILPTEDTRIDSLLEISPVEQPRPGYSFPYQHRIIPPSIKGHGRLIVAHRTVPYWVGALFVLGAFAWGVWCALYAYQMLGGHSNG